MDRIFGAFIKQLRIMRELSQHQAAKRSHITQAAFSMLEDGARWPLKVTIARIGMGLEVTPEEFFTAWAHSILRIPKPMWDGITWYEFLGEEETVK